MTDPAGLRFPDPLDRLPALAPDGTPIAGTVFLNRVIDQPGVEIGDYTYASDFDPPADWLARLAPYQFPFSQGRLRIGKFCQIAHGVRFITAGASHAMDGLTSFPFPIFDPETLLAYQPDTRDTVVGNDVWLGRGAIVCPGARIGSGAVVGAGAVVRGAVPDYAVVTGNPARIVRMRLAERDIARMLALAWWDWPAERIAAARPALMSGDLDALEKMAGRL
jgi:virginiamycin A acetyltransferase